MISVLAECAIADERRLRVLAVREAAGKAVKKSESRSIRLQCKDGAEIRNAAAMGGSVEIDASVGEKSRVRAEPIGCSAGQPVENGVARAVGLQPEHDASGRRSVAERRSIEKPGPVEDQRRVRKLPVRGAAGKIVEDRISASVRLDLENSSEVTARAALHGGSVEKTGSGVEDEPCIGSSAVRRQAGKAVKQHEAGSVGLHLEDGSHACHSSERRVPIGVAETIENERANRGLSRGRKDVKERERRSG